MIIIEGPDGAGKSTLVRHLKSRFNMLEGERATADRNLLWKVTRQDTYTALAEAVRAHERPRIWDRLFFSELVYSPTMGRVCEFKPGEQDVIRRLIAALGVPVIVCYPPLAVTVENTLRDDQMEGVKPNIEKIWRAYPNAMAGCSGARYYDYTDTVGHSVPDNARALAQSPTLGAYITLDRLEAGIERYLERRTERSW